MITESTIRDMLNYMKELYPDKEFEIYEGSLIHSRSLLIIVKGKSKRRAIISIYHRLWTPMMNELDWARGQIKDILLWLIHGIDIEDAEIIEETSPMNDFAADQEYMREKVWSAFGIPETMLGHKKSP